jgi:hypothetical protein
MNQALAPKDNDRYMQMESVDMAGIVDSLKGLFHDSKEVAKQYRDGMVGRALGLDWYENERVYAHTVGSDISGTINDATFVSGESSVTVASCTPTVGDIIDFGTTCKAVHPETKATLAHNAQFVVTAVNGAVVSFSPAIVSSGATQNVSAVPANGQAVTVIGTANGVYPQHLVYHKDAFAFATADLEMPGGVDFAAREVFDGLSIRVVRQYDINSDNFPCRLDILHGYEAIRPEWACRVYGDS